MRYVRTPRRGIRRYALLPALLLIMLGTGIASASSLVSLEVYTNGEKADAPPGPSVPVGSPVTWTYVVTNTGWGAPCYVQVTDDRVGAVTDPVDGLLSYGESRTMYAVGTAVAGQYANTATVEAWVPAGEGDGTASATSHYCGVVPPAVPPSTLLPTYTKGDGRYDDVNGKGRLDFADVVLYFNGMDWIVGHEPLTAFDYNRNGRIDFADAVWLFDNLGTSDRTFTVTAVAIGPGRIDPRGRSGFPRAGTSASP